MNLFCFIFITNLFVVNVLEIKIGGLFNNEFDDDKINIQEFMFQFATQIINDSLRENIDISFKPNIKRYEFSKSSLEAEKSVCSLLSDGIAGIFGPQSGNSYHIIQAICDIKEIPHIKTRWDLEENMGSCSVNVHPHPAEIPKAFMEVIYEWQWKEYIILYENAESLRRISLLFNPNYNLSIVVKLKQLILDTNSSYRNVLRDVKETEVPNIIVDCSIEILPEILKQAQQVGLMSSHSNFLITNLDFQTLDLEPYQYSGTNIIGFRLFNPLHVEEVLGDIFEFREKMLKKNVLFEDQTFFYNKISVEVALIYDAVMLYTNAASVVLNNIEYLKPLSCESDDIWQHGFSIVNFMKLSKIDGLTGVMKFDHQGFRSEFDIHIVKLEEDGLHDIGKWNSQQGITVYDSPKKEVVFTRSNSLKNMTFNVIISLTPPYGMIKKSYQNLVGNDQYEGFCIDLIKELSFLNENFSINFIASKDGMSGKPIKTENSKVPVWDGMIGSILRKEAHLACGDLTITREREEVVDITSPFMDLGIAILYKKPQKESPGFFSFLSPFKTEVWILVITAYITVSLLFFIMARISPYEWRNPFPCVQDPVELENQFTLNNSFWFTMGALMQQGSEIAPVSVSTRMAAGVWWFFTLIMVSCYTANLAAFLTTENPSEDFANIDELAQQTDIKYGAKRGGTTLTFFNESAKSLHKQMFNYMMANANDVLTESSQDGVKRAASHQEKYAFLMESSQIEYETERECSLTQVGKPIDSKGYGIAMEKNSWYLGIFSQSILKMQEGGTLSDLKRKWWNEKYAGSCPKEEKNDAETLGLLNLGGVFLVLFGGSMVGAIVAVLEFFLYVWSISKNEKVSMKERLKKELKFFFQCRGTSKPVESYETESNGNWYGRGYRRSYLLFSYLNFCPTVSVIPVHFICIKLGLEIIEYL